MGKRIFMFPGQGAQYVGMGKDFYDNYEEARKMFDLASTVTELDIPALCFEENELIHQTEYTQICMLATEAAILAVLKNHGIQADATLGLSLGEYGALIATGAMKPEDAFYVIRQRGIFMQQAFPEGGAMAAVLSLDTDVLDEICKRVSSETGKIVSIANYNCPGQLVITGHEEAVGYAGTRAMEAGARKVVPLKVSGPFHSQLLENAGMQLGGVLQHCILSDMEIPYVANVTADYVKVTEEIKPLLVAQVSSPVKFLQSAQKLIADGADEFVEIGPGKTLCGFMRKIDRNVKSVKIETVEDFKAYVGE